MPFMPRHSDWVPFCTCILAYPVRKVKQKLQGNAIKQRRGGQQAAPPLFFYTYPIAIRWVVLRHSRAACTASTAFGELMVT